MTTYRPWQIWWVKWKHEDGTIKDRPALLFSDQAYINTHDKFLFLKITTQNRSEYRFSFSRKDAIFPKLGLKKDCHLYPSLHQMIHKNDILGNKPVGCIPDFNARMIYVLIRKHIAITTGEAFSGFAEAE
jgi:mRNA-degrading endonuclease toxin of MazEF toxin-antitoxin module